MNVTQMNVTQRDRDLGTAYAMKPSTTRTELTSVGRGTRGNCCGGTGTRSVSCVTPPISPEKCACSVKISCFSGTGTPGSACCTPVAAIACLERMDDGEFVEADDTSIGGGGPAVIPCNWLQHFENVVDPYHVPVLHGSFSGPQFTNMMASMPEVKFEMSPRGVTVRSIRHQDDGKVFYRVTEAALPTLRVVPNPRVAQFARVESIGWTLPIDDTSFRIYVAGRVRNSGDIGRMRSKFNGKFWWDMNEQEHQQFPGDYEAQVGQGPVTLHSEEHFGQSDRGILMIRRMLSDQLEAVAAGRDPIGVSFDQAAPPVQFEAGNFIREA